MLSCAPIRNSPIRCANAAERLTTAARRQAVRLVGDAIALTWPAVALRHAGGLACNAVALAGSVSGDGASMVALARRAVGAGVAAVAATLVLWLRNAFGSTQ